VAPGRASDDAGLKRMKKGRELAHPGPPPLDGRVTSG